MTINYKKYAEAVDRKKAKREAEENYAWSEANKGHDNVPIKNNPTFIALMSFSWHEKRDTCDDVCRRQGRHLHAKCEAV